MEWWRAPGKLEPVTRTCLLVPGGGEKQQTPVVAPVGEFGSSDPDLSDSDWDESDFQFILSVPSAASVHARDNPLQATCWKSAREVKQVTLRMKTENAGTKKAKSAGNKLAWAMRYIRAADRAIGEERQKQEEFCPRSRRKPAKTTTCA